MMGTKDISVIGKRVLSRGYDSVIRRMQSWVCLLYNLYNTNEFILHMAPGHTKKRHYTCKYMHVRVHALFRSLYILIESLSLYCGPSTQLQTNV